MPMQWPDVANQISIIYQAYQYQVSPISSSKHSYTTSSLPTPSIPPFAPNHLYYHPTHLRFRLSAHALVLPVLARFVNQEWYRYLRRG